MTKFSLNLKKPPTVSSILLALSLALLLSFYLQRRVPQTRAGNFSASIVSENKRRQLSDPENSSLLREDRNAGQNAVSTDGFTQNLSGTDIEMTSPSEIKPKLRLSNRLESFFQWMRTAGGLHSKEKSPEQNLSFPQTNRAQWSFTRRFGFDFEKPPSLGNWKVSARPTGTVFLSAQSLDGAGEIFFAAQAKDKTKTYSDQIGKYFSVAQNMTDKVRRESPFLNLKFSGRKEDQLLREGKIMRIGLTGKLPAQNTSFQGSLLFFQTPTHFIGAYGVYKEPDFAQLEKMMDEVFTRLSQAAAIEPKVFVQRATEKKNQPAPVSAAEVSTSRVALREKVDSTKRKPWEIALDAGAGGERSDRSAENAGSLPSQFELCPTCKGRAGCPNPQCDRGFVACEICKENPPPPCRKCKGTGLRRVENPFTRLDTWEHCDRCYGMGKRICENNCRGGKLKCDVCTGTGQCPDCHGRGGTIER